MFKNIGDGFPVLITERSGKNPYMHSLLLLVRINGTDQDLIFIFKIFPKNVTALEQVNVAKQIADAPEAMASGYVVGYHTTDIELHHQVHCWYHMQAKVNTRFAWIKGKVVRIKVIRHINRLQVVYGEIFWSVMELFKLKWLASMEVGVVGQFWGI